MSTISKRNKYDSPAYWMQLMQLMLHDSIKRYLEENRMSRADFARMLGVSKGYVSQILNGDFDHKLSKLTELALACGMVPRLEFVPKALAAEMAGAVYLRPSDWRPSATYRQQIRLMPIKEIDMNSSDFQGFQSACSRQKINGDASWIAGEKLIVNNKIA